MKLQSLIAAIYPPQCLNCDAETEADFALCAPCWRACSFISGLVCHCCGLPLPGDDPVGVLCDQCQIAPRPWVQGRACALYGGTMRKLILALKHGDRSDLAPPLARWMAATARQLPLADAVVAPVPLHWQRLFKRRYNQAALLSTELALQLNLKHQVDLLTRIKKTTIQDGISREERYHNLELAFLVPQSKHALLLGKSVLIVDDVMTSGATLSACTEACYSAGAKRVMVLALARVARDA